MFYWNQSNFEGLLKIAESYKEKIGYEDFASYCLLREQGHRKEAFVKMQAFIDQSRARPVEEQRRMALELAELYFKHREVHQLIPQNLMKYIEKVIESWCSENPITPEPYRWFAVFSKKFEFFEKALSFDPHDQISLACLAEVHLSDLDFATHHLGESQFLGLESDAESSLAKASSFALRLPVSTAKTLILDEISYFRKLIEAWQTYRQSYKEKSFPEWSAEQGYDFTFRTIIYYQKE